MAELVYAFDLKSNGAIRTGSSPVPATIFLGASAGKSRSGYHIFVLRNSKIPNITKVIMHTKIV